MPRLFLKLRIVWTENQPAAQLVLPAAVRPPVAVPATTAPVGVFCTGGQCYFRPPKLRGRKGR